MKASEVLQEAKRRAKEERLSEVEAILLVAGEDGDARDAALNALDIARAQTWSRAIAIAKEEGCPWCTWGAARTALAVYPPIPGSDLCEAHDNQRREEQRRQMEKLESDATEMQFVR